MDAQMEGVEATMTDTIQHAEKGEEAKRESGKQQLELRRRGARTRRDSGDSVSSQQGEELSG